MVKYSHISPKSFQNFSAPKTVSITRTSSLNSPVGPAAVCPADDSLLADLLDPAALLVHHLVLGALALVVAPVLMKFRFQPNAIQLTKFNIDTTYAKAPKF